MTSFSAVIASYNQRERLLEAIESVHGQTAAAHEIVVVDDGSTDGTAAAVRDRYPDVKLIVQENLGKGVARNHGALVATGDWVCFLDHDDLWHPEKLAAVNGYLEKTPDAVAIDHGCWIFREDESGPDSAWALRVDFTARTLDDALHGMTKSVTPANDFSYLQRTGRSYERSLSHVHSTTSALCIRRDVFFKAGGFNPAQANAEDWALSTNVARLGEWHTLPRSLSFQRVLPTADSNDPAGLVMILASLVGHWYSGRPLRERTSGLGFLVELRGHAAPYRQLAQSAIWGPKGPRREASSAFWLAMLVLPRWRDRLYAMLPPQATWRFEHGGLARRWFLRFSERRVVP
jgi:glycosyltransferase involved in cell wall biosynthesis